MQIFETSLGYLKLNEKQNQTFNAQNQRKLTPQQEEIVRNVFQKHKKKRTLTNNVLKVSKRNYITYYIPVYCRLKIKNVASIDFQSLSGRVNVDIIISIYYGGLQQKQKQFLKQNIYILFPKDPPIKLAQDQFQITLKQNQSQKLFHFTVRKFLQTQVRNQIYLAPFQKLIQILTLQFQKIGYTNIDQKTSTQYTITFKFNLMNYKQKQNQNIKISLGNQKSFGMYTFAEKMMRAYYTNQFCLSNQSINSSNEKNAQYDSGLLKQEKGVTQNSYYKQKFSVFKFKYDDNIEDNQVDLLIQQNEWIQKKQTQKSQQMIDHSAASPLHYAHFILPMYKQPMNVALKIFFPLFILGIINIGIPYQSKTQRAKQVFNAAALMISFIALVPTIRQSMGHGDGVSFIQGCVFLQACTTILTLIHVIWNRTNVEVQIDLPNDAILILNIIITCMVFIAIIAVSIWHQCYMKIYVYHIKKGKKKAKQKKVVFNRRLWKNAQCDIYFQRKKYFQKNYQIQIVEPQIAEQDQQQQKKK